MSRRVLPQPGAQRRLGLAVLFGCAILAGLLPGQPGSPSLPPSEAEIRAAAALREGDLDTAIETLVLSVQAHPEDPRAYRDLADALFRRGDFAAAERFLRERANADPRNPSPRYALGKLLFLRNDRGGARSEAEAALRRDPHHGYAHLLLGLVDYTDGRPREALRSWRRARRELARAGDRVGEALAWNNLAMVHLDLHEYERARSEYERTLHLHRALGNLEGERIALSNLGLTLTDMGQCDRAIPLLRRSLELSRQLHDPVGECRVMEFLCDAHQKMGAYEEALGCADSMIILARAGANSVGEAAGRLNLATAYNDLGEPLAALRSCERGLVLAESLGHPRYQSALLVTLGETEMRLGRLAEASAAFRRCDSLSRAAGVPANAAIALAGLSQAALQEGDTARALQAAEEALGFSARVGYTEGEGQGAGLLSELNLAQGSHEKARALAERSLAAARKVGRRVDVARALARRAQARRAGGDLSGALTDAREGQRIARVIGSPEAEAACALAIGDALRSRDPDAALEAYRSAIEVVETVQGTLGLDEFKAGYLQNRRELYYRAADLLVELNRPGAALEISERSRARAFRDFLASGPRHLEETARPGPGILTEIETRGGLSRVPDAELIAQALGPDEAVLEYFLGPAGSLCLVVRAEGVTAVRLALSASEAASAVEALLRPLHAPRSLATLTFDAAMAESLRRSLVDPVRAACQGVSRLYVVPDGSLHYLPFEMLPEATADGPLAGETAESGQAAIGDPLLTGNTSARNALYDSFRSCTYLGDRCSIIYLPAAGLLCRKENTTAGSAPAPPGRLLGLGSSEAGLRQATREVERIGRLYPDALVLTGAQATERSFKELAPGCNILHISAHGAVDAAAPLYSSLRLAADREGLDDGLLHAFELLPLRLSCDLVTLSACESGLGRLYAGEGLLGLARSFLCAGASRTVVSLWSVNDPSTTRFMELFYRALSRGLSAAEALRAARLGLREEVMTTGEGRRVSLSHPFFWAPFVLVEGGGGS